MVKSVREDWASNYGVGAVDVGMGRGQERERGGGGEYRSRTPIDSFGGGRAGCGGQVVEVGGPRIGSPAGFSQPENRSRDIERALSEIEGTFRPARHRTEAGDYRGGLPAGGNRRANRDEQTWFAALDLAAVSRAVLIAGILALASIPLRALVNSIWVALGQP